MEAWPVLPVGPACFLQLKLRKIQETLESESVTPREKPVFTTNNLCCLFDVTITYLIKEKGGILAYIRADITITGNAL